MVVVPLLVTLVSAFIRYECDPPKYTVNRSQSESNSPVIGICTGPSAKPSSPLLSISALMFNGSEFMATTKHKIGLTALLLIVIGTPPYLQQRTIEKLRSEIALARES